MKDKKTIESVNDKFILILIFIAALAIRLIPIMNLPNQFRYPTSDAAEYDILAMNLLEGKGLIDINTGLPSSWRVPLYPLFLASIYAIFGHNYFLVRIIQCIMGALVCVFLFFIGREIFDRRVGFLSAVIAAFYKPFIFYLNFGGPAFLLSESLFTFLLALLVFYLVKDYCVQSNLKNSVISGILIGLLALTRPFIALFPFFLFGLLLYKIRRTPKLAFNKTLIMLIGLVIVIAPWVVRNYFVHREFIPFSTEGGFALLSSNNPYVRGGGLISVDSLFSKEERNQLSKMSEVQRDRVYRSRAVDFLFSNYNKLPKLFCRKLLAFLDLYATYYYPDNSRVRIYNIWFSTVFMFGIIGIFKSIRSKLNIGCSLLILLLLYFCFLTLIFNGEPRFRYPVEPYVIIFASVGILYLYNHFKNKFLSYLAIGLIIAINLLFYAKGDLVLNYARHLLNILL